MKRHFHAAMLAAACALLAPLAAEAQQVNIRGVILSAEGGALSVRTREGETVAIDVPKEARIATTRPFTLADIKPGMTLGVTTVKRADGATVAIDVRPIPATAGLGLSPFDLQPESTMTNAVMDGAVASADGQELTLNYKTGSVKVLVPPGTPMSQSAPGEAADLKPGETLFAVARPAEGGKLTALRVQVSKDGVKPTQ
jgi:hypothetical protein